MPKPVVKNRKTAYHAEGYNKHYPQNKGNPKNEY